MLESRSGLGMASELPLVLGSDSPSALESATVSGLARASLLGSLSGLESVTSLGSGWRRASLLELAWARARPS